MNKKTLEFSLEERVELYKKAIQLHNDLGRGSRKIGEFLGINQNTVSDWLYRGRSPLTIYNKIKETQEYLNSRQMVRQLKIEKRIELYHKTLEFRKKFEWGYKKIAKELKLYPTTVRGWTQEKKCPLRKINMFEKKPSKELSYIIGAVMGDGNLKLKVHKIGFKIGRIRLNVKEREFALVFNKCLTKLLRRKKPYSIRATSDGRYEVVASSIMLTEFLTQKLNDLKPFIEAYPSDFIKGFADSEGWPNVTVGKEFDIEVQISNSCKEILEYVKFLLWKYFNIKSIVAPHGKPGRVSYKKGKMIITRSQPYILRICNFKDVKRFAKYINFSIKSKLEKLLDAITIKEKFGTKNEAVEKWKEKYKKAKGIWVKKS